MTTKFYQGPAAGKTAKELLGFSDGYITIFKGNTFPHKEMLKASGAKYSPIWLWYLPSGTGIPALPEGIEAVTLYWDKVGNENGDLYAENLIKQYVETLMYDSDGSEFVGSVGERLDLMLTLDRYIQCDGYGVYVFFDADGNKFSWATGASRSWVEGEVYHIRGTVKAHSIYHNSKQTKLSRCTEVK